MTINGYIPNKYDSCHASEGGHPSAKMTFDDFTNREFGQRLRRPNRIAIHAGHVELAEGTADGMGYLLLAADDAAMRL